MTFSRGLRQPDDETWIPRTDSLVGAQVDGILDGAATVIDFLESTAAGYGEEIPSRTAAWLEGYRAALDAIHWNVIVYDDQRLAPDGLMMSPAMVENTLGSNDGEVSEG